MPRPRRTINRLELGPIVGHTDATSTRVWIQALADPAFYALRIPGAGLFPFVSTESNALEFRTGIAIAHGLRSDRIYSYDVLRRGRRIPRSRGRFRTMATILAIRMFRDARIFTKRPICPNVSN
jgi:hypothetical protein